MKKIFTFMLAALILVSVFGMTACQNDGAAVESTGNSLVKELNDFEYFDRDVQIIRMCNEFGRLDSNTDKKYVKSGEKSLKITPLGSRVHTANPYIVLPTSSTRFPELNVGDFTELDKISMWFYNAEESVVNVGIGFAKGVPSMTDRRDVIRKTAVDYFALANGWNYIEYEFRPDLLVMQGLDITAVSGIVFEFEYVVSHDLADSPEVYLDDVKLHYAETAKSTVYSKKAKTGVNAEGKQYWSIADFEDVTDQYGFYYYYEQPAPPASHPMIKQVFAGDYGLVAKEGMGMLLIQQKHGGNYYGWPKVILSPEPIKAAIDAIGRDIYDHPENYAVTFDVYNKSAGAGGWRTEYYLRDINMYDMINLPQGGEEHHSISVDLIVKAYDDYKAANPETDKKSWLEEPLMYMVWDRFNTAEDTSDRQLFMDNLRIVKLN